MEKIRRREKEAVKISSICIGVNRISSQKEGG